MIILYMREQICKTKRLTLDAQIDAPDIPRLRLTDKWSPNGTAPTLNPSCSSVKSLTNPLKPKRTAKNWSLVEWNDKAAWASESPGAVVTFEFTGTKVGIFYWRTEGKRDTEKPGRLGCWVDQDTHILSEVNCYGPGAASTIWSGLLRDNLKPGRQCVIIFLLVL